MQSSHCIRIIEEMLRDLGESVLDIPAVKGVHFLQY